MQIVDWIALGIVLLAAIIGLLLGFGKALKIFTSGIVGVIISIVVTYFLIGVVGSWGFVNNWLSMLNDALVNTENFFCIFLKDIGISSIILAIVLFAIVQLTRILIVNIIKGLSESDNTAIRVIDKILGIILSLAFFVMIALVVFQIFYLIGGNTAETFHNYLKGAFRLDWVYEHNPLQGIADLWIPKT